MPTPRLLTAALLLVLATGACSDDETTSTTTAPAEATDGALTIEAWVDEFDRMCVETTEALSDPSLTDAEFSEISATAVAQMRSIGEPATQAEDAALLLDTIDAQSSDTDLSDEEITAMDERFLETARKLGVSNACIGGAPG